MVRRLLLAMTQPPRFGTYHSTAADDDQGSSMSSRKKESRLNRFKKRMNKQFRRDRTIKSKTGASPETCTVKVHNVNPCHSEAKASYTTLDNGIMEAGHYVQSEDRTRVHTESPEANVSSGRKNGDSGAKSDKSPGLLTIIRNSFRRLKNKPKQPDKTFKLQKNEKNRHENPTPHSKTPQAESIHPFIEDSTKEADDITDLFEKIIEWVPTRKPDRSQLRLDGLVKCKPANFDKLSPTCREWPGVRSDLSSDVETDGDGGKNITDGPTFPTVEFNEVINDESDGEIADRNDSQRAWIDIAHRLRAIGDSIVNKQLLKSESKATSFRAERRLSSLELDIIKELRNVADTHPIFRSDRAQPNVELLSLIARAIQSLLKAPTYDEFKQAVSRELADTVGWDQVAWYTYLVQTSMLVVKCGISAGQSLRSYSTRFFRSNIQPWIRERPNRWESIYEETYIDTQLD
ncbi:uncharacterized protein LOC127850187 isoform X2 [Dreissena polymorpha]|uniref:uncharacterized protein LOC127850187 isoform X2 n=1 Tax=Dreissena polymorpha TaxID=45954 RepID=UPI002263C0EF|nr:uncharacterized protein LOC127850187 isoform X2 [Dreissena polymorpha]